MRLALRQLAKSPGFAATAILTLALGIGTCTAMFSIVHAVLLRPLPFREPDQLVWIENTGANGLPGRTSRADTVVSWREQNQTFAAVAAFFAFSDYFPLTLTGTGDPESARYVAVSDNFLPTLGVSLPAGRNFTPEECTTTAPRAVILSHGFWQRRFAGDPKVLGRTLNLNNSPAVIIGILPRTFDFDAIFTPGSEVDFLTPFPLTEETAHWGNTLFAVARLRPGATVAQAQAELDVINDRLRPLVPQAGDFGAFVQPIDAALRGKFRGAFLILSVAVLCVLAIACVNLSNLLLVRNNARRQEFSVRIALGAAQRHLVRQALAESLLLATAGSLVGVPLAIWATRVLARLQTFGVPLLQDASVNLAVLGVTIGLTALAGVVCGLLPALHLARGRGTATLQNATHQRSAGRTAARARNTLVIAEVALACMLLVGAGLLLRSFNAVLQTDLGFQPQHAMVWHLDPIRDLKTGAEADVYFGTLARRIAALPGVEAVGFSDTLPLSRNRMWGAGAVGVEYAKDEYPLAIPRIVDPQFLRTMKIPLVAGRHFDADFDPKAEKTVIINESLAHRLWPGSDPLGRKIHAAGESTVIGVAANVRHGSPERAGDNEMYLDYRQCNDWTALDLVVRSTRLPESLIPEVRAALVAHDPSLPTGEYYPLESLIDNAVAPRRFITGLLGLFSTLALGLAALGLYGVVAYSVTQRRQEIGIRMAVGAQRRHVLQLILGGGLRMVAIGVAIGLAGSLALTGLLRSQLYGVAEHDPLTFGGIALLLLVVATLACLLPALRAIKVDPLTALRAE